MAGGYGAWYFSPTAWDVIDASIIPPGYSYCKVVADFFTAQVNAYWLLEPHDEMMSTGYALANPGAE